MKKVFKNLKKYWYLNTLAFSCCIFIYIEAGIISAAGIAALILFLNRGIDDEFIV